MPMISLDSEYARAPKRGRWTRRRLLDQAALVEAFGDEDSDCVELEISDVELHACNLSGARVGRMTRVRLEDCKLTGVDASGGYFADVTFVGCTINLASFRMAQFLRVTFVNCVVGECDFFEASLREVKFTETDLHRVSMDRTTFKGVDLRGVGTLDLLGGPRLTGCLISVDQVQGLAMSLALATGVDIQAE